MKGSNEMKIEESKEKGKRVMVNMHQSMENNHIINGWNNKLDKNLETLRISRLSHKNQMDGSYSYPRIHTHHRKNLKKN